MSFIVSWIVCKPTDIETVYAVANALVEHDDQAWSWTDRWQHEADADKEAGRISRPHNSSVAFMDDLTRQAPDDR